MITSEGTSDHYTAGALILILLGIFILFLVIRYPRNKNNTRTYDLKFRVYGIGFILAGIAILIAKLRGKL